MASKPDSPTALRPTTSRTETQRRGRGSTISSVKNAAAGVAQTTRKAAGSVSQVARDALNADPPLGAWAAAAQVTSQAPTIGEIRQGAFDQDGWHEGEQVEVRRRQSSLSEQRPRWSAGGRRVSEATATSPTTALGRQSREADGRRSVEAATRRSAEVEARKSRDVDAKKSTLEPFPPLHEAESASPTDQNGIAAQDEMKGGSNKRVTILDDETSPTETGDPPRVRALDRAFSSGYIPPPHLPWTTSSWIGFKAFLKWASTPLGFLITVYSLNVVAWGGMLFLLLCNASAPMCYAPDGHGGLYYNCNDIDSPRRIWIEIDSQILNALFCVTGFGLIPWRFRDLYYLLRWRLCPGKRHSAFQKLYGLRVLAGINKGWLRLPGSDTLDQLSPTEYRASVAKDEHRPDATDAEAADDLRYDSRLPLPLKKTPPPPLTGVRAPPTALWKLDFFIWAMVWNTFFQVVLCGFMWGLNRYDRPSWATGLFIGLGCVIAGVGGIVSYVEGGRVKRVEGVRASEAVEREVEKMRAREDALEMEQGDVDNTPMELHVRPKGKEATAV